MRTCFILLCAFLWAGMVSAQVLYPPDAGVINIKTAYGAAGDGVTDDTAVIQQAVNDHAGHLRILYFPNGTYRISDSIVFPDDKFFVTFQGESEAGVIIRLADGAAGFGNPNNPKPMFRTAASAKDWTNDAFMNNFYDMTLDAGANNPGAVGILYIANNQGSIRNVTIRSSDATLRGYAGIDMSLFSIPGPCLLQHVTIIGFDYGVRLDHAQYSATAEHLHLSGQRVAGIHNRHNLLNLRGVTAAYDRADVPVILNAAVPENQQQGMIVLIDSFFTNSVAGSVAAIQNHGDLFARNVTTHGFSHALDEHGESVPGDVIEEYVTGGPVSLFSGANTSLNLPIEETPTVPWDDPATWINVLDYGVIPGNGQDDAPGVQAAIDAATAENRTLYFPRGHGIYQFGQTVVVRGYVQRIVGMQSDFMYLGAFGDQEAPLFRLVDGTPEQEEAKDGLVVLEQIWFPWIGETTRKPTFIVNERSGRTLVRNSFFSHGRLYDGSLASGQTFFDDVIVSVQPAGDTNQPLPGLIIGPDEQFWGRQLNPETRGGHVRNDGGDLWVLGLKTEQYDSDFKTAPHVHTRNGGRTELLGAFIHAMHAGNGGVDADAPPVFIIENAQASITAMENANNDQSYPLIVRETRGGVTQTLSLLQSPANGSAATQNRSFKLPLYIGYAGTGNQAPMLNLLSPAGGHANLSTPRLALVAEADDDGLPGPLTVSWTHVSGPAGVAFANPQAATTDAMFPADGDYVLRLTADDGELSRAVDVYVTVDFAPPTLPLDGLVLRYDLDETGGTHVPDTSGLGNHGAIVNLAQGEWMPDGGVIDGAYQIQTPPSIWNWVNGRIHVSTNLPATPQQTITAWVRQEFDSTRPTMDVAHINGMDFFFNHEHRQIGVRTYYQEETPEGNGNFNTRTHSGTHTLPPKGSWMHVAVTFDGTDTGNAPKFYLNGEELNMPNPVMGGTGGYPYMARMHSGFQSTVGARAMYPTQGMHDGTIDQFLVYDRVLDADDIRRVYESNLGNFAPVVDAGPDLETETGETIALQGSVHDDGLPFGPGALTIAWSKLNGPAGPSWEDISSPTTEVTFVNAGIYTFRLEAFDGALTSYDIVTVTVTGDDIHYPPTAHDVTVSGTLQVGHTLSLSYDYADANDAPEDTSPSGTSFRWLRGATPDGTYSVIPGATATEYTLVSADYGHYLRAEVTPRALVEPYTGDPELSPPVGPVLHSAHTTFPVADGLLAFWPFDDRVSPTADWSPNQFHASLVGDTAFAPDGHHGSALLPVAGGGTTASFAAAPASNFTFTAWVRHNTYTTDVNEIIVGQHWDSFAFYVATGFNNGQLRIQFKDDNNAQYNANYNDARDFIPAGQWVHLAAVRDGSTFRLYVNGVLRAPSWTNGAGTEPIAANAQPVRVGHMPGAAHWDGLIDQVTLHDRALSEEEINTVMHFDPGTYSPPPKSYAQWADIVFAHLEGGASHPDADPMADPDEDGVVNLLEHALGGDPFEPNTAPKPAGAWIEDNGDVYFLLVIPRNPDATDVLYQAEFTTDLVDPDWSSAETVIVTDTPALLTIRDSIPAHLLQRRYARLRVELQSGL